MHRRSRSPLATATSLLVAVALLIAALRSALSSAPSQAPPVRPNIVLINMDDMNLQQLEFMPNVRRLLVAEGVSFTTFYVTSPICSPSRASLLRGQYPQNTHIYGNSIAPDSFTKFYSQGMDSSTIATWMKAAGYRTSMIAGTYILGYAGTRPGGTTLYSPPGWDETAIRTYGDISWNYKLLETNKIVGYGQYASAGTPAYPENYQTDVFANKAVDFLHRTTADQPFFLYVAPNAPHAPALPAPRHSRMFASVTAPRFPSFNEADVSDKPALLRSLPLLTDDQRGLVDTTYRATLQTLQAADEMIGRMIATLEASGQLPNTYIMFTSDNGFHFGEHRLGSSKGFAYDEDNHVPLIIRGPGVPRSETREHLTVSTDLAPTIADLAGATVPSFVDGRSLRPLLQATPLPRGSWRQAILNQYVANSQPEFLDYTAIRTDQYVYIEYANGVDTELYDLRADPFQLTSLHADPARDGLVRYLASRLAALKTCAAASCRTEENRPFTPPKVLSFENGKLTDTTVGTYAVLGPVTIESAAPLVGQYSASIAAGKPAYLRNIFTASDDVRVSFLVRVSQMPSAAVTVFAFTNAGTLTGNLRLLASGQLQLRSGATVIGVSPVLATGDTYRVVIHQRRGSGANGLLEAFAARADASLSAPFASRATLSLATQANTFFIGALADTATNTVVMAVDDVGLQADAVGLPTPTAIVPVATATATATPTATLDPTGTPTHEPTETVEPSATAEPTPTETDVSTPTETPTVTETPSSEPTETETPTVEAPAGG